MRFDFFDSSTVRGPTLQLKYQALLTAILVTLNGCDRQSTSLSSSIDANATDGNPASIGPQFWKYDLSDYTLVDSNVLPGLGGRWISVRYQRKSEQPTTRDAIISRITTALHEDGWKEAPLPAIITLSKLWETSSEDLHFTRGAKEDEPEHWFFSQTIFVSKQADVIAIYCEVGW